MNNSINSSNTSSISHNSSSSSGIAAASNNDNDINEYRAGDAVMVRVGRGKSSTSFGFFVVAVISSLVFVCLA
jgi:hypothetical protein